MKELDVQKALIDSAVEAGGFGWKTQNRFLKGVSDVLVKFPTLPATLIEVKMVTGVGRKDVKVELTPHQERFIKNYQKAGGVAGWLAVMKLKTPGSYNLLASSNVDDPWWRLGSFPLVRHPGKEWPIYEIASQLARELGRKEYGKTEGCSQ